MSKEVDGPSRGRKTIVFIFPLVYRPLKDNFSGRFKLLSHWYTGHIFALSGGKQRNLPVSEFLFHSERSGSSAVAGFLLGLWAQIVLPLKSLWGKTRVDAIVAYDPYKSGLAALLLKYPLRCRVIVEENGEYYGEYERNEPGPALVKKLLMRLLYQLSLR